MDEGQQVLVGVVFDHAVFICSPGASKVVERSLASVARLL